MWLCLYMLLLKKWLHPSHSLSYSPVWTSEPFTSSTSTWGSLLPAGTLATFELGSFSGVGSFSGWLPWSPFSLDGSCWGIPMSPGSGSSGGQSPWSPTSTEVSRELILCLASLLSSSLYSAEKRKKQMLQLGGLLGPRAVRVSSIAETGYALSKPSVWPPVLSDLSIGSYVCSS